MSTTRNMKRKKTLAVNKKKYIHKIEFYVFLLSEQKRSLTVSIK